MAHILVVDDSPTETHIISMALEKQGHRVSTAVDGNDGINVYKKYSSEIDIIITDIGMPNLSGDQMINIIRGMGKSNLLVIAMSGYLTDSKVYRRDLFNLILSKPVDFRDLLLYIHDLIIESSNV